MNPLVPFKYGLCLLCICFLSMAASQSNSDLDTEVNKKQEMAQSAVEKNKILAAFKNQNDMKKVRIPLAETLKNLTDSERVYIEPFHHGTLEVGMYSPKEVDKQQPHDKDEVYIVVAGTGKFFCDGQTVDFVPGDVLFVPAAAEHRFEEFSDDFVTWVIFYGPEGGEKPE